MLIARLICPTGCFLIPLSSPARKNISLRDLVDKGLFIPPSYLGKRGVARSSRTVRRDAVDATVARDERTEADGGGVGSRHPVAGAQVGAPSTDHGCEMPPSPPRPQ